MTRRSSRLPPPEAYAARRAAQAGDEAYGAGPAPGFPVAQLLPQAAADDGQPAHHGHRRADQDEKRRRPRVLWVGAAFVLVVALVVGAVATGLWRPSLRLDLAARTVPGPAVARTATTVSAPGGSGTGPVAGAAASPAVQVAVAGLLAERAKAVRAGDVPGIEASAAGGGPVFDAGRLAALPISGWRYRVENVTTTADPARFDVSAALEYRLAGEPAPTGRTLDLVVAEEASGWRVVSERSQDGVLPWELGRLRVVRGERTLVIGVGATPGGDAALRDWASDGDAAVDAIRAAVPGGWPGRLTLVVPASSAQAAGLTGRSVESLQGLAAVTLAEPGPGTGSAGVFRVYVDTPLVTGMSAQARRILLRHEVTHVATAAPATDATPLWLEEGFAQYLGYRGSGVSLPVAVQDLRGARLPTRPPADTAFTGAGAAAAYEAAQVLCTVMADEVGESGLLRVYRRTADGMGLAAAWHSVARQGVGPLLAAWQARMRTETGAA